MAYDFKNEEEVQEYLENIGTEYRFSCFKEKNAEGCHLLGDYLEALKTEYEAAAKIYKTNCDEKSYAKSCLKYATYNYLGKGLEQNFLTAFDYSKKACELGSANGCLQAGFMLTLNDEETKNKLTVEKDFVKGLEYLEKSCALRNAKACFYASGIYMKGTEDIPRSQLKAAELSALACDGGNIYACMNMSNMYKYGDGVEKNEKKSIEFKERAKEIRDDMRKKKSIGLQQYT